LFHVSSFQLKVCAGVPAIWVLSAVTVAGKIGYGTVSETLACNTPLVFVRRDHFNEEPFLRKMLEVPSLQWKFFQGAQM